MGIFTDLVGSLMDMGKLSILMKTLQSEIEVLKKSGKCPEDLLKAFNSMKNTKSDSASGSVDGLENFVKTLEKHSDLFSDDLKSNLPKIEKVVEDLEKKAKDVEKLNKK